MNPDVLPPVAFQHFNDALLRIVESQEQVATTKITRNLEEQDLLERLIEGSKPGDLEGAAHYLLATPFRYPPLTHGSRFGGRHEASLFYGALELPTCLQECAYYRFLLWYDMATPPPSPISTQHTVFTVQVKTAACVDVRAAEYDKHRAEIMSPTSYAFTHRLGTLLRAGGAQMILFGSARGPGTNAGVFHSTAFASRPQDQELWNSQVDGARVMFSGPQGLYRFNLDRFADRNQRLLRVS